jgi:hypothetical protein
VYVAEEAWGISPAPPGRDGRVYPLTQQEARETVAKWAEQCAALGFHVVPENLDHYAVRLADGQQVARIDVWKETP